MIFRRRWSPGLLGMLVLAGPSLSCSTTGPETQRVHATVEFLELEGGCWSLLTTDGVRYEPLSLAEEFRRDGLEVEATLTPLDDMGSICMVGKIVEVESIRLRR